MDAVAEFYSHPQTGGAIPMNSSRREQYHKYAIPLYRTAKERVGDGVAEAVKIAGGKAIQKFAKEDSKTGEKRKLRDEGGKFRQRFVESPSSIIARSLDEDDKGKPIRKKHKRNRID